MPDVYAVAAAYREEMLALDRKAARRIAEQYRGVYTELQKRFKIATDELERLRADPEATQLEIEKALFKSDRWRQAYNEARDELQRFNAVAKGIAQDAQGEAIDLGAEHMDGLMRAAISGNRGDARGPLGIDYSFAKPDTQAMAAMIGFASNGSPLASLFQSISPEALGLARGVLAQGVALGTSPVAIGKQLAGPLGLPAWRGLTIARTETLRAYREAQRQTVMANDDVLEGWIWHSARDRRTCEVCWSMDGRLFTVVAGLTDTAGHQSVAVDAVRATDYLEGHICCRCTLIPRPKSYGEILGDPSLPDERPPIITGAEAFAKLSPGQQASILGPGKFALFQMGVPLEAFVNRVESSAWGASRVAKPLFQLAEELKAGGWSGGSIPPAILAGHRATRQIAPPEDLYANPRDWKDIADGYVQPGNELGIWANSFVPSISDEERAGLQWYSGTGYAPINDHLRGRAEMHPNIASFGLDHLRSLQELVSRVETPEAVIVHRGVGSGRAFGFDSSQDQDRQDIIAAGLIGQTFREDGFMSTSFSPRGAFSGVQLELTVPKGYHGIPVSNYSLGHAPERDIDGAVMLESELILAPGVRYVVTGIHRDRYARLVIEARVLLPNE